MPAPRTLPGEALRNLRHDLALAWAAITGRTRRQTEAQRVNDRLTLLTFGERRHQRADLVAAAIYQRPVLAYVNCTPPDRAA